VRRGAHAMTTGGRPDRYIPLRPVVVRRPHSRAPTHARLPSRAVGWRRCSPHDILPSRSCQRLFRSHKHHPLLSDPPTVRRSGASRQSPLSRRVAREASDRSIISLMLVTCSVDRSSSRRRPASLRRGAPRQRTLIRSTTKTRVSSGPIARPAPRLPYASIGGIVIRRRPPTFIPATP
jgi:hypothetical protein